MEKTGSDQIRSTPDLRGSNSQKFSVQISIPHLDSLLKTTEGRMCLAKIYMAHAYWKLPLAREPQEIISMEKPLGVYSSRRLFQGSKDEGNNLEVVTEGSL